MLALDFGFATHGEVDEVGSGREDIRPSHQLVGFAVHDHGTGTGKRKHEQLPRPRADPAPLAGCEPQDVQPAIAPIRAGRCKVYGVVAAAQRCGAKM
jgi:hypothetical protein